MNNVLITDEQRALLLANGREFPRTWTYGLCDLGLGMPELGQASLHELATLRGRLGLPVEQDLHFRAEKRLSAYARDARLVGRTVV